MSTNFPIAKDNLTNPTATSSTSLISHASQHANANDAIEALQTKVGVNNSTDVNSLDYKVRHITLPVAGTDFIAFSEKGLAGGVATLDSYGKLTGNQIPTNISVSNLIVGNSITLNGTATQINTTNLTISDPMIYLGENNSSDSVDLGFVSSFNNGMYQHAGLVRDASDGTWKLFQGVTDEPGITINFDQASYATLKAGAFVGDGSQLTNLPISPAYPTSQGIVYGKTAGTNVALGQDSLRRDNSETRFNYTTAIGTGIAGENYYSNTTVDRLTAIGYHAGTKLIGAGSTEGAVIIGDEVLANSQGTGIGSVVIGSKALYNTTIYGAPRSVVIGANAGLNATSISQSVVIGYNAGQTITGSSGGYNIIIGHYTEPSGPNAHHEITLGNQYMERFRIPGLGIDWTASTIPSQQVKFNNKTSSYTLQASDNHKMIRVNASSDSTITIPENVFSVGDEITIQRVGDASVDIVGSSSVLIESTGAIQTNPLLKSKFSAASIVCVGSNVFTVIGDVI